MLLFYFVCFGNVFFVLRQCSLSSWVRLLSLGKAIVMGLCLVCDNGYHPQKHQEPSVPTEHWVPKKWQALFTSLVCLAWSHKWQNNKKTNETSLLQQTILYMLIPLNSVKLSVSLLRSIQWWNENSFIARFLSPALTGQKHSLIHLIASLWLHLKEP